MINGELVSIIVFIFTCGSIEMSVKIINNLIKQGTSMIIPKCTLINAVYNVYKFV